MTRDEAIKIWDGVPNDFMEPKDIIEKFVKLGMLKVDESKPSDFAADLVVEMQAAGHAISLRSVERALDRCRLKLVEDIS